LNAAGRLGQAQLGIELLTTTSAERATALAEAGELRLAGHLAELAVQADPDDAGTDAFSKRYPNAVVRNFDGKGGAPTEMDALVAYLQMLGTLVDFKLYNEKANLR